MKLFAKLITGLCALLCAQAAVAANLLSIADAEGAPGEELTLRVSLSNTAPLSALQVDIPLPAGVAIEVAADGAEATGRAEEHRASAGVRNGTLSFMLYSLDMSEITPGEGAVGSFRITLGDTPGQWQLSPKVTATDREGNAVECTAAPLTLKALCAMAEPGADKVDFGRVPIRATYNREVTMRNSGTAPLTITAMRFSDGAFTTSTPLPLTIAPGANEAIGLTYAPVKRGATLSTVTLECNSPTTRNLIELEATPYAVNELTVGNANGISDTEVTIPVSLKNMDEINGFSMSFRLPAQLEYVEGSLALSPDRADGHLVSVSYTGKTLKATCYSLHNTPFKGNKGEIASFKVRLSGRNSVQLAPSDAVLSAFVDGKIENVTSDIYPGRIGISSPNINVASAVWLGRTPVTDKATTAISVYNYGNAPLCINNAVLDGEHVALASELPVTIEPWQSAELHVECGNTYEGTLDATLQLYCNDPDKRLVNIAVGGERYAPNEVSVADGNATIGSDKVEVLLSLDNYDAVSALQFDIEYPATGFTPADDASTTQRTDGFMVTRRAITPTRERYFCYSLSGGTIAPGFGEVFGIPFSIDTSVTEGTYDFSISNIIIGTPGMADKNSDQAITRSFAVNMNIPSALKPPVATVANPTITSGNGYIYIAAGTERIPAVSIYTSAGNLIYTGKNTTVGPLPPGIYLVSTSGHTTKLAVN